MAKAPKNTENKNTSVEVNFPDMEGKNKKEIKAEIERLNAEGFKYDDKETLAKYANRIEELKTLYKLAPRAKTGGKGRAKSKLSQAMITEKRNQLRQEVCIELGGEVSEGQGKITTNEKGETVKISGRTTCKFKPGTKEKATVIIENRLSKWIKEQIGVDVDLNEDEDNTNADGESGE